MLGHRNGLMAIHHKRNKLITVLRTALEKGDITLDMEATIHEELTRRIQVITTVLALVDELIDRSEYNCESRITNNFRMCATLIELNSISISKPTQ